MSSCRRGRTLPFAVAALALASCFSKDPRATAQERKVMSSPLELRIAAIKSRTIAREGVRLEVTRVLSRDMPMDSVELNAERTRVTVKPLDSKEPARELSGKDFAALYRHHPLKEIGSHYDDKVGTWTSILELWHYTRPLAPGRYELAVSYRWGDTPAETARSNAVTVEVAPARGLTFEPRWLSGSRPREHLGSLWTAKDGATVRWVFEVALGEDPTVVKTAADLDVPALETLAPPVLARPSGWGMGYEQYAVWLEKGRVGWVALLPDKRLAPPASAAHGLLDDPRPRLADPPLRRHAGGLVALAVGRTAAGPAASLVEVDVHMKASQRLVPLPAEPLHAAVSWGETEAPATGTLFLVAADGVTHRIHAVDLATGKSREVHSTPHRVLALALEPGFNGTDKLLALTRHEKLLRGFSWDFSKEKPVAAGLFRFDLAFDGAPPPDSLADQVPLDDGRDFALLFKSKGFVFRSPETTRRYAAQDDPEPRLVTTPRDGHFLVFMDPAQSLKLVGQAPPDKH